MTIDDIARDVEERLGQRSRELGGYSFEVHREMSFQDEEGLWHVYVEPDRIVAKRGQFYDILNDIEEELEDSQHTRVMLVPVRPEPTTSEPGA